MYPYRLCFCKEGALRYISHLDLQRTFGRALRRTDIPVAYSRGFNPQPRLRFALPLALGVEGKNEYLDLDLSAPLQENIIKETLNAQLPAGLRVKNVSAVESSQPSLSSLVQAALYVVDLSVCPADLSRGLNSLLQAQELFVERRGKKGTRKITSSFKFSRKRTLLIALRRVNLAQRRKLHADLSTSLPQLPEVVRTSMV